MVDRRVDTRELHARRIADCLFPRISHSKHNYIMTDPKDIEIDDLIANLGRDPTATRRARNPHVADDHTLSKEHDLRHLIAVWTAERTCPDILPYENELMDKILQRIRDQVSTMEIESSEAPPAGDEGAGQARKLRLLLIESELERIKFLARGYLRARLHKIDKYATYILQSPDEHLSHLCASEIRYTTRRTQQLKEHYDVSFLSTLPSKLRRLDDDAGGLRMVDEPSLDDVVFVRVMQDLHGVVTISEDEEIELKKGNIYALPYYLIRQHLALDKAQLV
ncbi:uncharacterized protein V1518DRAFT_423585 [Limtongia smithiae]|uniref:uncharacterized protein n=1 Tax=Limtongia smithiae TaxID=1125753 RepID=UPI0034CEF1C5